MSNIQPIQTYPVELQPYVLMLKSIQILNVPLKDLQTKCKEWIGKAYFKTGFNSPTTQALQMMVETLALDLKNHFSKLTVDEVSEAIRRGSYKDYGEFMTISNTIMFDWVRKFKNTPERNKAVLSISAQPAKDITTDEKKSIFVVALATCQQHFKKTGLIQDAGGAIYRQLWKEGKIRFDVMQWQEYLNQSRYSLLEQYEYKLTTVSSTIEKREIEAHIKQLNQSIPPESVKNEARKLALKDYLAGISH